MASDLSRSLVDAAARMIAASDVLYRDMNAFDTECEWAEQQHYLRMGRDSVTAVLEALAVHCDPGGERAGCKLIGAATLNGLAAEVREGA